MMNKKSFIIYMDQQELFETLSDEEAGKIIKAIFNFQNGKKVTLNRALSLVFISLKQTLVRDEKKWLNIVERNKINGKKGGRPRLKQKPKKPSGLFGNPKNLDSDSDSDKKKNIYTRKKNGTKKQEKPESSPTYLNALPESDLLLLESKTQLPSTVIIDQAERAFHWLEAKGTRRKNYRSFLINWLKKTADDHPELKTTAVKPRIIERSL